MSPGESEPAIELVRLSVPAMEALVSGDLGTASREACAPLTPYLVEHAWLWRIRLEQVAADPTVLDWIARAALDAASGAVVGHVGFHGPPDEHGMVEVAYSVDPPHRRRGYAKAMLRAALEWAAAEPAVRTVRASVSPDNAASLATLRPFGFERTGAQWDDEDGLEMVLERPRRPTMIGMTRAHPDVDAYIRGLPSWQQEVCDELRQLVWAADPDIEETIKRSVQPYFVLDGNVCALLATKDHVNLFLYDPTVTDPHGLINQGHGNATGRAIQIYEGDEINRAGLVELLREIVAHNRAGGWRRLAESQPD